MPPGERQLREQRGAGLTALRQRNRRDGTRRQSGQGWTIYLVGQRIAHWTLPKGLEGVGLDAWSRADHQGLQGRGSGTKEMMQPLSHLPLCHLFGFASPTCRQGRRCSKQRMRPSLIYLHVISLAVMAPAVQWWAFSGTKEMMMQPLSNLPACHLFGFAVPHLQVGAALQQLDERRAGGLDLGHPSARLSFCGTPPVPPSGVSTGRNRGGW